MKLRLYIENYEVELDESVKFAITKQFEDLSNPTTIINDWSKTVSIPFTQKNNEIFGHIYNPDRLIVDGSGVGIYFNPLKKLDFRLVWGDTILMTGYAKLNEVKQTKGKGTYEITLFGQLGKVFAEMKKITFDKSTTDTDYLINGSQYVKERINKGLVYDSWTSSGQTQSTLQIKEFNGINSGGNIITTPNPSYKVTDIIGFAPNNSFSEGFKYDTYQTSSNTSDTFENELGSGFTEATGVEPKTIIPNGYLPREIGEYRSYLQLPFIYWNKLFQVFQIKAQSVTGYQFNLDSNWFSTSNPYWYNLVYMLKPFNSDKKGELYNNLYSLAFGQVQTYSSVKWQTSNYTLISSTWQETRNFNYFRAVASSSTEVITMCDWDNPYSKWTLPNGSTVFTLPMRLQIQDFWAESAHNTCYLSDENALIVTVNVVGSNGTTTTQKFLVKKSTCTLTETNATNVIKDTELKPNIYTDFDAVFTCDKENYGDYVTFNVNVKWKTTANPSTSTSTGGLSNEKEFDVLLYNNPYKMGTTSTLKDIFKSDSMFDLNDLWNNEYNLFDEIIKYCKMYRILISVDDINRKINFIPFSTYFSDYSVTDWTNKVDKSKDYVITPVTFDKKYILFNYKDSETKLGKEYREKYGFDYGEYRLTTDYNFNSDTNELFKDITPSIVYTDNVLSWKNLKNNHKIIYSFPAEIYVYNQDKDKKQVDIFGAYYFHNGLKEFDTETALQLVPPKISDDTPFQLSTNTFFYTRSGAGRLVVTTYPYLSVVKGLTFGISCLFNIPSENYTYLSSLYTSKTSIYADRWKNYLDERYNVQNKKITCYIKLSPIDFVNFQWNQFVVIGNQLCMVNKIYDYDITSNQPTKVDLITIQDVTGYTT